MLLRKERSWNQKFSQKEHAKIEASYMAKVETNLMFGIDPRNMTREKTLHPNLTSSLSRVYSILTITLNCRCQP